MTREEEIKEQASKSADKYADSIGEWSLHLMGFINGAEWADEHPKQIEISIEDIEKVRREVIPENWQERQDRLWDMIERNLRAQFIRKACEWLEKKACLYVRKNCEQGEHGIHKTMLEDFRKAMKGD